MNEEQQKAIDELRDQGYAIVIFNPTELEGATPHKVEDFMVGKGWDAISILKEQNFDEDDS